MSKVVTTTVLPDVAGGSVTLGGTGDSVVATGNDIRTNILQDAGGNAVFTSDGSGNLSGTNSAFAGAMKLLSTQTASNSASVSFTTQLTSTYDVYCFKFININPATDAVYFEWQGSTDGGSNYNVTWTTTYFYAAHAEDDSPAELAYAAGYDQAQTTNYQYLNDTLEDHSDACLAGELYLFDPASTTL